MTSTKICSLCKIVKSNDQFNFCARTKNNLQSRCRDCEKKRNKKNYDSNPQYFNKHSEISRKKRRQINREFIVNYLLQHSCIDCGEADPICLDFDHVRGKKYKGICQMVQSGNPMNALEKEITKCEVRCANCHRKKTHKQFNWFRAIVSKIKE